MSSVEDFLKELSSALQIVGIYGDTHPKSKEAVDRVYTNIIALLRNRKEIIIGIVEKEFVFEKEIFFKLSSRLKDIIGYLSEEGVEKMIFSQGVSREELDNFVKVLGHRKDDSERDFAEYFLSLGFDNISIGKMSDSAGLQEKLTKEDFYKNTLDSVSGSFKGILSGGTINVGNTRAIMHNILERTSMGQWQFLELSAIKDYDLATFVHSLNVAVLSMFFSSKLGFEKKNILSIGMASLFHDMGKIAISRAIIQKAGALTDKEMKDVKSHTVLGAGMLLRYVDSLGFLPVLVAFEHHLRYDLKGYPKLTYRKKPHIVSLIISLCDCYDALRARRSYKRDYPPEMIHTIMCKERGALFDPNLFDEFFRFLGVYPVNTIVELSNGFTAIVRAQNEDNIFAPKVEVVVPSEDKGSIIDLDKSKELSIKCSLNPLAKGKDYIRFI